MHAATKTEVDSIKTNSKTVVHKTAETEVELIGNKIAIKIVKPKAISDMNSKNVKKIAFSTGKIQEILNDLTEIL